MNRLRSLFSTVYRLQHRRHGVFRVALLCLLATATATAVAQAAPDIGPVPASWPKAFDAASIKPGDPDAHMIQVRTMPGGKFTCTNLPLKQLLALAFNVKGSQLVDLPGKLGDESFSIEANPPADTPQLSNADNSQMERHMLQALLATRFGLTYTTATKDMDVYNLIVAKSGSKLKPSAIPPPGGTPDAAAPPPPPPPAGAASDGGRGRMMLGGPGGRGIPRGAMMMGPGMLRASAAAATQLANSLANDLGRMVYDKTGLTGTYDFELHWTPGQGEQMAGRGDGPMMINGSPVAADGPSLYTALQEQLGLKLESAKGPVPVIQVTRLTEPVAN